MNRILHYDWVVNSGEAFSKTELFLRYECNVVQASQNQRLKHFADNYDGSVAQVVETLPGFKIGMTIHFFHFVGKNLGSNLERCYQEAESFARQFIQC